MTKGPRFIQKYQSWLQMTALLLVLIFLVGTFKNIFLKQILVGLGPKVLGVRMDIDGFSLGILRQRIGIKGLRLYNPEGFPNEVMLDVPEVTVQFNPWRMLTGRLYMSSVVIHMRELVIIRNHEKQLNVDALKIARTESGPPDQKDQPEPAAPKSRFMISELSLNLERVVVKDFSKGEEPFIQVHEIPLKNKTLRNIDSFEKLITILIVQAMGPTAIKSAGIYAAAAVLGVGFLPAGVLGVIVADDDSALELQMTAREAFDLCLAFIAERGTLKKQHRAEGFLHAKIEGHDVKFEIEKVARRRVKVVVTARKFMLPKPAYAGGIVYQLEKRVQQSD